MEKKAKFILYDTSIILIFCSQIKVTVFINILQKPFNFIKSTMWDISLYKLY